MIHDENSIKIAVGIAGAGILAGLLFVAYGLIGLVRL